MISVSDTSEAAVDDEILTADICVFFTDEPRYESGNLLRPPQTLHGHAGGQLRDAAFAEDRARELGVDEAGRYAVGQNAVGRNFCRQSGGHPVEREFAR